MVWPETYTALDIERYCIQMGGQWTDPNGVTCGAGLFHHFREMQTLLWPEEDSHRWSDLILTHLCANRITVVQGARDTGKTNTISKFILCDYWCFPNETLSLVSSTGTSELERRVWGNLKDLFRRATERWPGALAGNVVDSKHAIFTDQLDETGDVRDHRKGIVCVPCIGGQGEWVGMQRFQGIKQKRRRLFGDELQFMHLVYLSTLDAIDKGEFKGVFAMNPIGGNGMAGDRLAEPKGGWSSIGEVTKTCTWENKYGGITINLVGTDSPNFDAATLNRYPYLINQSDVDKVAARNGKDSAQFWTLIMGVRKTGVDTYRVLTVEMCERCLAFTDAVWGSGTRTKVYGIDAGYGGDPCKASYAEFGKDASNQDIIAFAPMIMIPVSVTSTVTPEDQIAAFARADCDRLGVPYENVFFEAGMRATLGVSMSRELSPLVNAVNFGGPATERPVSNDLFTMDPRTGQRRPIKCNEQYSKFVTELWYSMREATEGRQVRSLPREAAGQFGMREWRWVPGPLGQRYELETKPEYKARAGESPNDADAVVTVLEGARRLGFTIARIPDMSVPAKEPEDRWLEREIRTEHQKRKKLELNYQ
jgi:hypothetical protein